MEDLEPSWAGEKELALVSPGAPGGEVAREVDYLHAPKRFPRTASHKNTVQLARLFVPRNYTSIWTILFSVPISWLALPMALS